MFLALRDIAYARGRFALMTGVVALITLLLVMLSGLTGGLGKQNTSALEALNPDGVIFSSEEPSFTESSFDESDLADYTDVTPLGAGQTRLETQDETAAGVAVFGLPAGTKVSEVNLTVPEEGLAASQEILDETGISVGDTVALGGQEFPITDVVDTSFYSHSPVLWASTETWNQVAHAGEGVVGTVLMTKDPEAPGNEEAVSLKESFKGLASYSSEQGSLVTMQGFLYAISALVTVAFLTVWTIQRTRDLSILRALGAAGRYLLKDALGQAAVILAVGVGTGAFVGWLLGLLASQALPFELSVSTILIPAAGIWILGILGALLATRKVSKTDPMLALGGNA